MDDTISRQTAIDALRGYLVGKRCPDDGMIEIQNISDCYLRLPCGICRLTMADCPKLNQLAYITTSTGTTPSCETNMCAERREVTT